MLIDEFRFGLDPVTLELLAGVFDRAWAELRAWNIGGITDEFAAREILSRRIIAAAIKLGTRDPEKLKSIALDDLELG